MKVRMRWRWPWTWEVALPAPDGVRIVIAGRSRRDAIDKAKTAMASHVQFGQWAQHHPERWT